MVIAIKERKSEGITNGFVSKIVKVRSEDARMKSCEQPFDRDGGEYRRNPFMIEIVWTSDLLPDSNSILRSSITCRILHADDEVHLTFRIDSPFSSAYTYSVL